MATGLVEIAAVEQDYVVVDWRETLPSDLQGADEFLLLGGPPAALRRNVGYQTYGVGRG